jgi:pimeloyl-ACP methyl ester carboxylesterase
MKKLFLLLYFSVSILIVKGQNNLAKDNGLIHHSITDKKLGKINFYLTDTLNQITKPIIIYLDGSGNKPFFTYHLNKEGKLTKYSSIPFNYKVISLKYHIVFISKPNTPLVDTLNEDEFLNENAQYNKSLSAEWRVHSASKVLDFILKNYSVDRKKIVVMGYSEGGQVAPRLAAFDKRINYCMAFVSGGLNQFFDQIIENRINAQKGEISQQKAQDNIDSLYLDFEKIYNNPNSTDHFWFGHTYLRWSSFCSNPTINYFVKLNIPIYVAQGTNDLNTSVLSSDYIRLEFLRMKKNNLTQVVYPDCDHLFNKLIKRGDSLVYENILDTVIDHSLLWLNKH